MRECWSTVPETKICWGAHVSLWHSMGPRGRRYNCSLLDSQPVATFTVPTAWPTASHPTYNVFSVQLSEESFIRIFFCLLYPNQGLEVVAAQPGAFVGEDKIGLPLLNIYQIEPEKTPHSVQRCSRSHLEITTQTVSGQWTKNLKFSNNFFPKVVGIPSCVRNFAGHSHCLHQNLIIRRSL